MDAVVKGYPYAKASLDFACLRPHTGRWLGLPVHMPCWAAGPGRTVPVTHSIGLIAIAEAKKEVALVAAEGIRTIKIKIGPDAKPRHRDGQDHPRGGG